MRIVLLGPPASGKGTQGRKLAVSLGLAYLSTGAVLREHLEEKTPLGEAARPILARGEFLPDDLMEPIIAGWLAKNDSTGWVLDGYPRSVPQAEFLDQWLAKNHSTLDAAIALEVPLPELLKRIRGRVECADCRWTGQHSDLAENERCPKCGELAAPRADDDEENFRNRHAEFIRLTLPVVERYAAVGKLIPVSAIPPQEQVAATILREQGARRSSHPGHGITWSLEFKI